MGGCPMGGCPMGGWEVSRLLYRRLGGWPTGGWEVFLFTVNIIPIFKFQPVQLTLFAFLSIYKPVNVFKFLSSQTGLSSNFLPRYLPVLRSRDDGLP